MNHNHLPQNPWYPNTQPLPPQPPATTHTMNPWFNSPQAPIVRPPPHTSGINNFIPSNGNFHAQSHLQDQQQQSLLGKRPRDLEDSAGRDDTIASELKGVQTGADGHRYGGAGLGVGYGQGVESEWRQTVRSKRHKSDMHVPTLSSATGTINPNQAPPNSSAPLAFHPNPSFAPHQQQIHMENHQMRSRTSSFTNAVIQRTGLLTLRPEDTAMGMGMSTEMEVAMDDGGSGNGKNNMGMGMDQDVHLEYCGFRGSDIGGPQSQNVQQPQMHATSYNLATQSISNSYPTQWLAHDNHNNPFGPFPPAFSSSSNLDPESPSESMSSSSADTHSSYNNHHNHNQHSRASGALVQATTTSGRPIMDEQIWAQMPNLPNGKGNSFGGTVRSVPVAIGSSGVGAGQVRATWDMFATVPNAVMSTGTFGLDKTASGGNGINSLGDNNTITLPLDINMSNPSNNNKNSHDMSLGYGLPPDAPPPSLRSASGEIEQYWMDGLQGRQTSRVVSSGEVSPIVVRRSRHGSASGSGSGSGRRGGAQVMDGVMMEDDVDMVPSSPEIPSGPPGSRSNSFGTQQGNHFQGFNQGFSKITHNKTKYTQGPRADCLKCQAEVPGHYGHWS